MLYIVTITVPKSQNKWHQRDYIALTDCSEQNAKVGTTTEKMMRPSLTESFNNNGLHSNYPFKPHDPHTNSPDWSPYISFKNSWENLVWDQSDLFLVINLVILITFILDDLLMFFRENLCWSLRGPTGLYHNNNIMISYKNRWDQFWPLGNCPPTPPISQH